MSLQTITDKFDSLWKQKKIKPITALTQMLNIVDNYYAFVPFVIGATWQWFLPKLTVLAEAWLQKIFKKGDGR